MEDKCGSAEQVVIDKPDIKGRTEIFQVHLKPLNLADDLLNTAKKMAALTPGALSPPTDLSPLSPPPYSLGSLSHSHITSPTSALTQHNLPPLPSPSLSWLAIPLTHPPVPYQFSPLISQPSLFLVPHPLSPLPPPQVRHHFFPSLFLRASQNSHPASHSTPPYILQRTTGILPPRPFPNPSPHSPIQPPPQASPARTWPTCATRLR